MRDKKGRLITCDHCGVALDELEFGPHPPECPVTKRGRTRAEALWRRLIECTPAVAADVLALEFREARRAWVLDERAACAALLRVFARDARSADESVTAARFVEAAERIEGRPAP